ncbi:uncharacterized protein LOC122048060 [Zingiber officinale]|uniref:uncharacterized protein LOC122048060 n=1 Tax=Zingiber officinale TaxID=94328 RepID=UPI001C4DD369|nr:uncharacterized protein LOC122048060 [Zingiber officinale]
MDVIDPSPRDSKMIKTLDLIAVAVIEVVSGLLGSFYNSVNKKIVTLDIKIGGYLTLVIMLEKQLSCSLEELYNETTKKMKISRETLDASGVETITLGDKRKEFRQVSKRGIPPTDHQHLIRFIYGQEGDIDGKIRGRKRRRKQADWVLFIGDFGYENVELVRSISNLKLPKAVILGNHDSWTTQTFSEKKTNQVCLRLECLGEEHVGYSRLDFPSLKLCP